MPTLIDVAKQAGVSPMTVSRVVNGSGPVSPEMRARVEQALADTGYVPNTLARNLRTRRTDTIGLVMPDMTNPFFTMLAQGVETAAREAGISLLLANTDQSEDEERRLVPILLQRQIDGLLIIPAGSCADTALLCRDQGVPPVDLGEVHGIEESRDIATGDLEHGESNPFQADRGCVVPEGEGVGAFLLQEARHDLAIGGREEGSDPTVCGLG